MNEQKHQSHLIRPRFYANASRRPWVTTPKAKYGQHDFLRGNRSGGIIHIREAYPLEMKKRFGPAYNKFTGLLDGEPAQGLYTLQKPIGCKKTRSDIFAYIEQRTSLKWYVSFPTTASPGRTRVVCGQNDEAARLLAIQPETVIDMDSAGYSAQRLIKVSVDEPNSMLARIVGMVWRNILLASHIENFERLSARRASSEISHNLPKSRFCMRHSANFILVNRGMSRRCSSAWETFCHVVERHVNAPFLSVKPNAYSHQRRLTSIRFQEHEFHLLMKFKLVTADKEWPSFIQSDISSVQAENVKPQKVILMKTQKDNRAKAGNTQLYPMKDYLANLSAERQAKIEEGAQRWQIAFRIAELRAMLEQTQGDVAKYLGITQPAVSKIERQRDMKLSTIASYVEALGGQLEVSARFGDEEIHLMTDGSSEKSANAG